VTQPTDDGVSLEKMQEVLARLASRASIPVPPARPVKTIRRSRSFALVDGDEIACWGRLHNPSVALHLELVRRHRLAVVRRQDGWGTITGKRLEAIGLADKDVHYRAVKRLISRGVIEVRSHYGRKLEYRLNPNWAKQKAEVVDPVTVRKAQKR
jgi:hypothetical protein